MAYQPKGGFDCDFIHAIPDSLKCLVCHMVVREPHILSCCGVKICKTCLATYKIHNSTPYGTRPQCPKCRQCFQDFQDKEASRQIPDLKVRCSRKDYGCNWEGELRCLDKHERETCQWVLVKCRHPKCGLNVPRLLLSTHECAHRPIDDQLKTFKSKMNQRYSELDNKLTTLLATQIEESNAIMASNVTDLDGKIKKVEHANNGLDGEVKAYAVQMEELQLYLRALENQQKRWKIVGLLCGTACLVVLAWISGNYFMILTIVFLLLTLTQFLFM